MKLRLGLTQWPPMLLLAVSAFGFDAPRVIAASLSKYDDHNSVFYYGRNGPNSSYQSGPRTRVYVTKRSWLDAGTEVLPGERKFNEYAFPLGYWFGRDNYNRPIDRQPLNPQSDMGGFRQALPLY